MHKKIRLLWVIFLSLCLVVLVSGCKKPVQEATIHFNSDGGSLVESSTYPWGSLFVLPDEPTKENYSFIGWYFDALLTLPVIEGVPLSIPFAKSITLYAKWEPLTQEDKSLFYLLYELAIDESLYEGTFDTYIQSFDEKKVPGTDDEFVKFRLNGQIMEWSFRHLDSWQFLIDFSDWMDELTNHQMISLRLSGNLIEYQLQGDSSWKTLGSSSLLNHLSAYELYLIVHEDYTKLEIEWVTDLVDGLLSDNDLWKVTFDYNDGLTLDTYKMIKDLTKVGQPTMPHRDGYTFIGWFFGEEKWSFVGYVVTENMTLIARWEPITYTITYHMDGGVFLSGDSQLVTYTYTVDLKPINLFTPVKEGYTFNGWFLSSELIENIDGSTFGHLELHASWSVNRYQLTLIDSLSETKTYSLDYQTALELPVLTDPDHTFMGWYLDENQMVENPHETMPATDLTLYARWQGNILNLWSYNIIEDTITTYVVEVLIKGYVDVAGFDITLYYALDELTLKSIINPLGAVINSNNPGYLILNYVNANEPLQKETKLLTLTFDKKTDVISPLILHVKDMIAVDKTYQIYPIGSHIEKFVDYDGPSS